MRKLLISARTLLRQVEARSPRQWLVENLLRSGDLCEIVEDAKSGKTTLIVGLLCALKRNVSFLGRAAKRAKIAYFGVEHDIRDLIPIFKANGVHNFLIIPTTKPYQFPHKQAYKNLTRAIKRWRLHCVALDPITDFIQFDAPEFGHEGFEENKATHWKPVIDPLLKVAKKTGCAILFARHKSKAATGRHGSRAVSVGRGSNYPETKASVLLNLTRYGNAGWSLMIHGKGISRQDMWLISGDGRYTFKTDEQRAREIKSSATYGQYQENLSKAVRAIIEQHGGTISGQAFFVALHLLRKSVDVPLRGKAFENLLVQAGIEKRMVHGRAKYGFRRYVRGEDRGGLKGGDVHIDIRNPTPKSTLTPPLSPP